mmetsp:Transcript_26459/g.94347  ORF Transcript_26459/g.94347 Transcript_26459/m.94347 type:complete len:493 (+) Transcript_26459:293-1771(+)
MESARARWRVLRKHVVWTDAGYVITEFLPTVSWAGVHNTIPAAAGHHIAEAQWLADSRVGKDYAKFWFAQDSGAAPLAYTNWIGHAAWRAYAHHGDADAAVAVRDGLAKLYRDRLVPKYLAEYEGAGGRKQCWWQDDNRDAMEVSISGPGCRPTISAAMYGEAAALVEMAELPPANRSMAAEFAYWRKFSRSVVLDQLWDAEIESFAVIPLGKPPAYDDHGDAPARRTPPRDARAASGACDLQAVRRLNETVKVRELLAFMPFFYKGLVPPNAKYDVMWKQLFDERGFSAPFGLSVAERRHACWNYSWEHGDTWNQDSWPYETARVLTAAAHVVHGGGGGVSRARYVALLRGYAAQHVDTTAVNDTGIPHVFENVHPTEGYWVNRARMYWANSSLRNMGNHYLHSTFNDLILSGLLGIRLDPNNPGKCTIHPLLYDGVEAFAFDSVVIMNRTLTFFWDKSGERYRRGAGQTLLVDGIVRAQSPERNPVTLQL